MWFLNTVWTDFLTPLDVPCDFENHLYWCLLVTYAQSFNPASYQFRANTATESCMLLAGFFSKLKLCRRNPAYQRPIIRTTEIFSHAHTYKSLNQKLRPLRVFSLSRISLKGATSLINSYFLRNASAFLTMSFWDNPSGSIVEWDFMGHVNHTASTVGKKYVQSAPTDLLGQLLLAPALQNNRQIHISKCMSF